jgi:hypothetical protein
MSVLKMEPSGYLRTSVLGGLFDDGEGRGYSGSIATLTRRWDCFTGRNQLDRVDMC